MKRAIAIILTFVMVISTMFSLASCDLFGDDGGALKLKSFVVDNSTIKTSYLVGEEVDFSGIKAYASYTDENFDKTYTFAELTLTYPEDITVSAGTKDLVVSFNDPNLNIEQKATVKIVVTDPDVVVSNAEVSGFQSPASLIAFNNKNKDGTLEYGNAGFFGEFINGGFVYTVGDDNAFKFIPQLTVIGESGFPEILSLFYSDVQVSVLVGDKYVPLTKTSDSDVSSAFADENGVLMVNVDTLNNTYQFSVDAVGKQFKLSVLPSADYYEYDSDIHAVTVEISVIDAYNVYEAWQLAVIDNDIYNTDWDSIKTEKGIYGLNVNGIVLHNDIKVTADDVPETFFYTTDKEIVYKNSLNPDDTKIIPAGTKYLKDTVAVYRRIDHNDLVLEGNLFNIDLSAFPIVASPAVFGLDAPADDKHYGNNFSGATFIRIQSDWGASSGSEDSAKIDINNVSLIGNASRDNYVDSDGNLVSAGGIAFIKSTWYTNTTVDNVISNSFFNTYFAGNGGKLVANNVKCYDSYQNAAMVWADSYLEFNDSYINGCGGPGVIIQSAINENKHPTFVANNTVMETHLSGDEIWFTAVNATSVVTPIKALGAGLAQGGLGNFVDKDGKMNIIALLMTDANDAMSVVTNPYTQGEINVNGNGIERWIAADTEWYSILTHQAFGAGAPFLSVVDSNGNNQYIYVDNAGNVYDKNGVSFGTLPEHQAIAAAFMSAEYITLSQGGLSVVFEFYHSGN